MMHILAFNYPYLRSVLVHKGYIREGNAFSSSSSSFSLAYILAFVPVTRMMRCVKSLCLFTVIIRCTSIVGVMVRHLSI